MMDSSNIITKVLEAGEDAVRFSCSLNSLLHILGPFYNIDQTMGPLLQAVDPFIITLKEVNICLKSIAGRSSPRLKDMLPWTTIKEVLLDVTATVVQLEKHLKPILLKIAERSRGAIRTQIETMDDKIAEMSAHIRSCHKSLQLTLNIMNIPLSSSSPDLMVNELTRKIDFLVQTVIQGSHSIPSTDIEGDDQSSLHSRASTVLIDAANDVAEAVRLMQAQSQTTPNETFNRVESWRRHQEATANEASSATSTTSTIHPIQPTPPSSFATVSEMTETPAENSDSEDELEVDELEQCLREAATEYEKPCHGDAELFYREATAMAESMSPKKQERFGLYDIQLKTATCCFFKNNFKEAEKLATQVKDRDTVKAADQIQILDATYLLAEILLCNGKYKDAERECRAVWKGRYKILGKEHPSCFMSLSLLSVIMEMQGNYARAITYKNMIPENATDAIVKARRKRIIDPTATGVASTKSKQDKPLGKVRNITPEAKAKGTDEFLNKVVRSNGDARIGSLLYDACNQGLVNLVHLLLTGWSPRFELYMPGYKGQSFIGTEDFSLWWGTIPETVMHAAIRNKHFEVAKLLLDAGAPVSIVDGQGKGPDFAALLQDRQGIPGINQLLVEAGIPIMEPDYMIGSRRNVWHGPIVDVKFCEQWLSEHKKWTTACYEARFSVLYQSIESKDFLFIDHMIEVMGKNFTKKTDDRGQSLATIANNKTGDWRWLDVRITEFYEARNKPRPAW